MAVLLLSSQMHASQVQHAMEGHFPVSVVCNTCVTFPVQVCGHRDFQWLLPITLLWRLTDTHVCGK